jgi:hypothetical protein
METMTIQIRKKAGRNIIFELEKLKVIKVITDSAKEKFKKRLAKDLKESLRQVELHRQGKIKLKSAQQLLKEL